MTEQLVLKDPQVGVATAIHYAEGIWQARFLLDEMIDHMDTYGPLLIGRDFSPESEWGRFFDQHVHQYADGVWAVRYLHPDYCDKLVSELVGAQYSFNDLEPVDAQIPEVVLEQICPSLWFALRGLFDGYIKKLSQVLMGLELGECVSIQAAKYTPDNTPHGCWHTDRDSEVTLVVALSDSHSGGGTQVYRGPLHEPTVVPQLAKGWAMLFAGRTNEHMGLPVTAGTRNLLVHWYKLEN